MEFNKLKQNKGVALLWTLIICLILMIVSGTMTGYIIKDSRASIRIEDSVQAYAAARSGLDWATWYTDLENKEITGIENGHVFDDFEKEITLNADPLVTATVTISGTIGDSGSSLIIDSTGLVNEVQRKLHYEIRPASPITDGGILPNNFKMEYDFWYDSLNANFIFGQKESDDSLGLGMIIEGNMPKCARLVVAPVTGQLTSDCIDLSNDTNLTEPYRYRATIIYISETIATLEISPRNTDGIFEDSLGSQSIDLTGTALSFKPAQSLFFDPNPPAVREEEDFRGGVLWKIDIPGEWKAYIGNTEYY